MKLRSGRGLFAASLALHGTARSEESPPGKHAGDVTDARVQRELGSGDNWLVNGGRLTGEHFSPLDQINASNVEKLGLAWAADIDGSNVIGIGERRLEGFIPDLRYMPAAVHQEWPGVVLGGTRRLRGMPGFADRGLSPEDSEALHAYVIDAAWKAYDAQQEAPEAGFGEERGPTR